MADRPTAGEAWHALEAHAVLARLVASETGLSAVEAQARLALHGRNAIPQKPPPAWWLILLRQLASPIIYILGVAAAVSLLTGHLSDAGFIAAVVLVNSLVGGFQEYRAERSARALQRLVRTRATVVRDGDVRDVDAEELAPGDIVWLESGDRVPADLRLLSAHGLELDESLLTGESTPVLKDHAWIGPPAAPVASRLNMACAGAMVVRGRGKGVVVATGAATSVGQLALDILGGARGALPLLLRLQRFTHLVGILVLAAAAVIAVVGTVLQRRDPAEMFFAGVALAVSAIPEGLPVAITIALAVAGTRMARRGVIVRRLGAVEGLGSCTLIASDKTGTLTCNELTVRLVELADGRKLHVTGAGFAPRGQVLEDGRALQRGDDAALDALALAAVLCNEADLHHRDGAWSWRGDPTDVALLALAAKLGWQREATLDQHPQINDIPFEPEHRFAASFNRVGRTTRALVKGAPERVLTMCTQPDAGWLQTHTSRAEALAQAGYRVLALAEGDAPQPLDPSQAPPTPIGLTFLGFVGMIDPPRPGVREAVAACRQAGITVLMVTGDHPVTALAIARDLGLADDPQQVVTGEQLEATAPAPRRLGASLSSGDLPRLLATARVFARVAPHQKLALVRAAQQAGHFVAVTGDGVNDAPALRAANLGVAMGRGGTDVAREAADLVIHDDNFATIVSGVEEGRVAYENIRKVVYLLAATGAAEVLLVMLAVAAGLPLPLLPVQLLWLNLVTNGIQDVALACEPREGDELRRRPRPTGEPIFNRVMIENTVHDALLMGMVAFAAFAWMLRAGWELAAARNAVLLLIVLFENVHVGHARVETKSALKYSPLRSPFLLAGVLGAFGLHVLMMHLPIGRLLLGTQPVRLPTWLALGALALGVFLVIELHKWTWRWRRMDRPRARSRPPTAA